MSNTWLKPSVFTSFIIAAVVFCVFSPMLSSSFKTMDDDASIVRNEIVHDIKNLPQLFSQSFFGGNAYYRPLVSISFMLEYHFFKLNASVYNFNNLIIHILNSLLVMFLILALTRNQKYAVIFAFIYGIHPIHWSPVCNIAGRSILLSAFFVLSAFLSYLHSRESKNIWGYFGAIILFLCACLSKESAAVFPLVLMAYELFLGNDDRRVLTSLKRSSGFWGVVGFIIFARQAIGVSQLFSWPSVSDMVLGFLTFVKGFFIYIRLIIFPADLHFDRSLKLLLEWNVQAYIIVAIIISILIGLIFFWRRISNLVKFALCWMVFELLPVSQIVTSIGVQPGYISLAEHFLYVASIPMLIVMYAFLSAHNQCLLVKGKLITIKLRDILLKSFLVGMTVYFALTSYTQAIYAMDEFTMISRSLWVQPNNARLNYSLGMLYVHRKDFLTASYYFKEALDAEPNHARYRIAYAKSLADQGRIISALRQYNMVQDADNLADTLKENVKLSYRALVYAYEAGNAPEQLSVEEEFFLGVGYAIYKRFDKALLHFKNVVERDPNHKDALYNLIGLLRATGQKEVAEAYSNRFKQISPANSVE